MNPSRMMEIAAKLGELYQARAGASLTEWQAAQDMERRVIEITPPEGWPGKNEEQRRAAKEAALLADDQYQQAWADHRTAHSATITIQADIDALEAERRALEWQVRAALVEALRDGGVQSNHRGDPAGNTAFDDAADDRIWRQEFAKAAPAASYQMLAVDDDEIPF